MDKKYLLLGALCLGFFTTQAYADTNKPQMIIPGYSYPEQSSTYWNTLQNNNKGIAYTILNQNNGEFTTKDANYERLFKDNTKKGLKNLAYVHLTYSKRDVKDIKENIKSYLSLYGKENVKGFFLDETDALSSNGRKQLKEVYNYIKSLDADLFVVANPGTTIPDSAYDYADVFCTFESSADNYINSYRKDISTWESDTKKTDKVMHIIYDTKPSDYDKIMALAQQRHAKYIFITSDGNTSLHKTDDFFDELPVNFTYLQSLSDNTNITTPITNNSDKVTENKSNVKTTVVNQVSDTEKAPTDTHEQNSASDTRTKTQSESNVANNTTASNGAPIDNSSVLSIRNNSSLVTKTDNQTPKASSEKERQKAEREKQKAEARKEKERQKAEREKQKAEARKEKERQKAEREKQKAEARKEKERQKAEREKQKAEARKEKERQKSKNTK